MNKTIEFDSEGFKIRIIRNNEEIIWSVRSPDHKVMRMNLVVLENKLKLQIDQECEINRRVSKYEGTSQAKLSTE